MLIKENILIYIDPEDVIDGVFIAPDDVLYVGNDFHGCSVLKMILPNVINIGDRFLNFNQTIISLECPNVKIIGNSFMFWNRTIKNVHIPNVEKIGDWFAASAPNLNYTRNMIKALKYDMYIDRKKVNKKDYIRKFNTSKLLL